MNQQNYA
jgi:hypothetical protein